MKEGEKIRAKKKMGGLREKGGEKSKSENKTRR